MPSKASPDRPVGANHRPPSTVGQKLKHARTTRYRRGTDRRPDRADRWPESSTGVPGGASQPDADPGQRDHPDHGEQAAHRREGGAGTPSATGRTASANSAIEPNRRAGSLAIALRQAASSRGSIPGRSRDGGGGVVGEDLHSTSPAVPRNGGRPVSSSYRITPRLYTSRPAGRPPPGRSRSAPAACTPAVPDHRPGRGQPRVVGADPPGQPEVGHHRLAALVEQDVGRLQVAVDHPRAGGPPPSPRRSADQPGRLPAGQRAVPRSRAASDSPATCGMVR